MARPATVEEVRRCVPQRRRPRPAGETSRSSAGPSTLSASRRYQSKLERRRGRSRRRDIRSGYSAAVSPSGVESRMSKPPSHSVTPGPARGAGRAVRWPVPSAVSHPGDMRARQASKRPLIKSEPGRYPVTRSQSSGPLGALHVLQVPPGPVDVSYRLHSKCSKCLLQWRVEESLRLGGFPASATLR